MTIRVEVVYALPEEQPLIGLDLEEGATAREAVERSGLLSRFPDIDPDRASLGIFGRIASADTLLKDGDRVEIYRPLMVDPKAARRNRSGLRKNRGR